MRRWLPLVLAACAGGGGAGDLAPRLSARQSEDLLSLLDDDHADVRRCLPRAAVVDLFQRYSSPDLVPRLLDVRAADLEERLTLLAPLAARAELRPALLASRRPEVAQAAAILLGRAPWPPRTISHFGTGSECTPTYQRLAAYRSLTR